MAISNATGYQKANLRLNQNLGITNSAQEVSICSPPAGKVATIKYVKATNTDTITSYLCISIGADVTANRVVDQIAIAANSEYERWVNWILVSGDILCASGSVTLKVNLTMTGTIETIT